MCFETCSRTVYHPKKTYTSDIPKMFRGNFRPCLRIICLLFHKSGGLRKYWYIFRIRFRKILLTIRFEGTKITINYRSNFSFSKTSCATTSFCSAFGRISRHDNFRKPSTSFRKNQALRRFSIPNSPGPRHMPLGACSQDARNIWETPRERGLCTLLPLAAARDILRFTQHLTKIAIHAGGDASPHNHGRISPLCGAI